MQQNELKSNPGARKSKRRVGRGNGSGRGTYSGRGGKGQTARAGGTRRPGFSGGQTPLTMRMPKLGGFKNINRVEYAVINVGLLEENYKEGEVVNRSTLIEKRLLKKTSKPIKVLGTGEINVALTVKLDKISEVAKAKIINAKGTVEC